MMLLTAMDVAFYLFDIMSRHQLFSFSIYLLNKTERITNSICNLVKKKKMV
jgi:hypothetical protein